MEHKAFWELNAPYKMPGTSLTVIGYSVAAERTGFYVPELDVMLDCGLPTNFTPEHIFITHCHCDHSWELPRMLLDINDVKTLSTKKVKVFIPEQTAKLTVDYIHSAFVFSKSNPKHTRIHTKYELNGVINGQKIEVSIRNHRWLVEIIECNHSVPTVGYGFSEIRKKLKPEYENLSGKEIGDLRRAGVEVSADVEFPMFCYLGDTTAKVFDNGNIWKYPTVFVECTYISDEHEELIMKNKHMHWKNLEPVVKGHPEVNFILYHFSKRYKSHEIWEFFKDKLMANMKLWVPIVQ